MATVTKLGESTAASGAVNPSQNIEVGQFIVYLAGTRGGITTASDNSSQAGAANTYTLDIHQFDSSGVDGDTGVFSCRVTRRILTTDTVSIPGVGGFLLATLLLLDPIATVALDKTSGATNSGTNWGSGTTAALSQAEEIAVGIAYQWGSNNAPTDPVPTAPWVEQASAVSGGNGADVGSQILASTTGLAFSGAWGVNMDNDGSAVIATYKIGDESPGGQVDRRMIRTHRGTSW